MNMSKRNYLSLLFLVLIVLLVSTVRLVNSRKDSSVIINDNSKEIVDLVFKPVEIEPLKEVEIPEEYLHIETVVLQGIEGELHLYKKTDSDANSKEVYGFIEHNDRFYETTLLSAYGSNEISIDLLDITQDGKNEIRIIGPLGASYSELKIISYDERDNLWTNLLTMGTPSIVDLNGDGNKELIGVSKGSLPSFVDIYRWNGEFFVMARVTEATKGTYAYLFNTGCTIENNYKAVGDWIIESGNENESHYYRYELGKLIKIDLE